MFLTLIVRPEEKRYTLYQHGRGIATFTFVATATETEFFISENGRNVARDTLKLSAFPLAFEVVLEEARARYGLNSETEVEGVAILITVPGTYFQAHQKITDVWRAELGDLHLTLPEVADALLAEINYLRSRSVTHLYAISDTAKVKGALNQNFLTTEDSQEQIKRYGYDGVAVEAALDGYQQLNGSHAGSLIICRIDETVSVTGVRDGAVLTTSGGYHPYVSSLVGSHGSDLDAAAFVATLQQASRPLALAAGEFTKPNHSLKNLSSLERLAPHSEAAAARYRRLITEIKMQIGGAMGVLGAVDAVIFTGQAAETNPDLRAAILDTFTPHGIQLSAERNERVVGRSGFIHGPESQTKIAFLKVSVCNQMYKIAKSL